MASLTRKITKLSHSRYFRLAAVAAFGVLVGALLMSFFKPVVVTAPEVPLPLESDDRTELAQLKVAKPERLKIDRVGLDATFEGPLGLNADKTVAVPDSYDKLGWYKYAPLPGEFGPAVVLGHVDSYKGPAVFYPLRQVKVGDEVTIERIDGSVATFLVTDIWMRSQSDFPTAAVYGDIDHAGLRLITCTGTYDRGRQVYSHNLIIFAEKITDTAG